MAMSIWERRFILSTRLRQFQRIGVYRNGHFLTVAEEGDGHAAAALQLAIHIRHGISVAYRLAVNGGDNITLR